MHILIINKSNNGVWWFMNLWALICKPRYVMVRFWELVNLKLNQTPDIKRSILKMVVQTNPWGYMLLEEYHTSAFRSFYRSAIHWGWWRHTSLRSLGILWFFGSRAGFGDVTLSSCGLDVGLGTQLRAPMGEVLWAQLWVTVGLELAMRLSNVWGWGRDFELLWVWRWGQKIVCWVCGHS